MSGSRFRFPWKTPARIDAELVEEFEFHVNSRADELVSRGVPAAEARRQAETEFGDAAAARAYCRRIDLENERAARRTERFAEVRLDIIYVGRTIVRSPGTAVAIVLMLGIALGINQATFTAANELLIRQLPVADPASLVLIHGQDRQTKEDIATSIADFRDLSGASRTLAGLAGFNGRSLGLGTDGPPVVVPAQIVSANYFGVLGLSPTMGRFFAPSENTRGGPVVAVISHRLWVDHFQASTTVIGRLIRLNGQPATVVGVSPPGFSGPFTGFRFDVFVPLGSGPALDRTIDPDDRAAGFFELFGRRRVGSDPSAVAEELNRLATVPNQATESNRDRAFVTAPMTGLDTELRSGIVVVVTLVVALSALGLLVASLNAGGLLLARGMSRHREFALRQALGAGRRRLIRLQLLEATLLVGAATAAGGAVSMLARRVILELVPALPVPLTFTLAFDLRVAVFVAGMAAATTLATGLAPAFASTQGDVALRLRGGNTDGRQTNRLRRVFLAVQVAVTFALLAGAGLLYRGIAAGAPAGLAATSPVATLPIDLSFTDLDAEGERRFFDALVQRVRTMPGVEYAAYAARLPFGFGSIQSTVEIAGVASPLDRTGFRIEVNRVSDQWSETAQVGLTRGRAFGPGDRFDAPSVALINEAMAQRFWPAGDPLHRQLSVNGRPAEVVGVVDDNRFAVPGRPSPPRVYLSPSQASSPRAILMVRGPAVSGPIAPMLREAAMELNPDLPIGPVTTLEANRSLAYLPSRLLGGATAVIAAITLALAASGLYGLLSFWVTTRRTELGIRSALGADQADVTKLAVRQGLIPATYGVLAGLALSIGVGMVLRGFLLGVSPFDPIAYLGGAVVFYSVAIVACLVPALRAARTNPIVVLRGD